MKLAKVHKPSTSLGSYKRTKYNVVVIVVLMITTSVHISFSFPVFVFDLVAFLPSASQSIVCTKLGDKPRYVSVWTNVYLLMDVELLMSSLIHSTFLCVTHLGHLLHTALSEFPGVNTLAGESGVERRMFSTLQPPWWCLKSCSMQDTACLRMPSVVLIQCFLLHVPGTIY